MSVALAEPNETGNEPSQFTQIGPALNVPRGAARRVGLKERAIVTLAAALNDLLGPREEGAFGILMYHRVASPPPNWPKPTWNVPPQRFEQQLQGLLSRGWRAWPLSQVIECLRRDLPIPRKTFVVTFDDGYVNVLTQAYPILTRLAIPATVFLATAYIDSNEPFPSDDWSVAGQPGVPSEIWRPLTTEECRRLMANGLVEFGAHTHTHADFRGRPGEFAEDLKQNVTILRGWFQVEQPAFALPYGTKCDGFASEEFTKAARNAGVACCLTTEATIVRPGDSPFDWGRFAAEEHDTARTLAARLGGWQEALRGIKRGGR
jgi:peptidoglycan/xylan/chitin deacetylase (PgdA/CDA1 family)